MKGKTLMLYTLKMAFSALETKLLHKQCFICTYPVHMSCRWSYDQTTNQVLLSDEIINGLTSYKVLFIY